MGMVFFGLLAIDGRLFNLFKQQHVCLKQLTQFSNGDPKIKRQAHCRIERKVARVGQWPLSH
jgi:hypothetical protein